MRGMRVMHPSSSTQIMNNLSSMRTSNEVPQEKYEPTSKARLVLARKQHEMKIDVWVDSHAHKFKHITYAQLEQHANKQ